MSSAEGFVARTRRRLQYLAGLVYQRQVKFAFPVPDLPALYAALPPPPAGYEVRCPRDEDVDGWAALLNTEGGFGTWTGDRVRREIVAHLIHPEAATLVWHQGRLIACGATQDTSSNGRKTGLGMYLYVIPAYQGKGKIAEIATFRTLSYFTYGGYESCIATTDPSRLAALALYLSNGCTPIRDSLWSWVQWRRLYRRLGPAIEAMKRRRERRRPTREAP